jgi:hypothetical protein
MKPFLITCAAIVLALTGSHGVAQEQPQNGVPQNGAPQDSIPISSESSNALSSGFVSRSFAFPGFFHRTHFASPQHGWADLVRSAGVYNYLSSEAMVNVEEARRKYIENRLLWARAYNEIRTRNREYHEARYRELNPPHTQEDFIRYAQADAPKRLSTTQLDPITGYIAWPRLLRLDAFAQLRRDIEKLFAQRARAQGAINDDVYFELLAKVEEMTQRLKEMIQDAPPSDYLQARKFLESLAYEPRFPTG